MISRNLMPLQYGFQEGGEAEMRATNDADRSMLSNFMGGGLNALMMDRFPQLMGSPAYQGIMSMAPENVGESLMNLPAGKSGILLMSIFRKLDDLYDTRKTYERAEGGSKGLFKNETDKIDEEIKRLTAGNPEILKSYRELKAGTKK